MLSDKEVKVLSNESPDPKPLPDALPAVDGVQALECMSISEFLTLNLPPRELILDPILPAQGLAMIHAPRGIGKTHVSLGVAYAVASGGKFLRWSSPRARGVLFVDGEMPANTLQERLASIVMEAPSEATAPLRIITPDLQKMGMPDLSSIEGQEAIERHIDDEIDLIILDNLSTLVRSGRENEAESWQPIQTWALNLRSKGKSVLFIHHSGKGGAQRGTSRREDVLDTVIALKRPADYDPTAGAVFEVHFEKARGIMGPEVEPFEANLTQDSLGQPTWTMRSFEDSTYDRVVDLSKMGFSQKEISIELGINKSNVSRHVKKATRCGDLQPNG